MSYIRIKYPTQVVKQKCLSEGPERHFFLILLLKVIRLATTPVSEPVYKSST